VPEIPRQRAEDRAVDAVEPVVVERFDQGEGALPRLGEAVDDPLLDAGLRGGGDARRLPARSPIRDPAAAPPPAADRMRARARESLI